MPRVKKMWVHTVDQNGQDLSDGHWVDIPEPDSFAGDGFSQIEGYVSRLLSSGAHFTSLLISTPDSQIGVGLWQRAGIPEFSLTLEWRHETERERSIRQLFADRGFACRQDYLAGNGDVPDATRCLTYVLPSGREIVAQTTKDILHDVYGVQASDALDFTYEERNDTPS
jgi:hypothetical protein